MYKLNYGENVLTHQKREMLAMTLEKKSFVCPACTFKRHFEFSESAIKRHVWFEHGKKEYERLFGPVPFKAEVKIAEPTDNPGEGGKV